MMKNNKASEKNIELHQKDTPLIVGSSQGTKTLS